MVDLFGTVGILAIVSGGLLAAFSANRPTRFKIWASAYLVLVVGVIQLGLAIGWQQLGMSSEIPAVPAFIIYNLGNICVVYGTVQKQHLHKPTVLVNIGGALLATSMLLLLWTARTAEASWALTWFVALVIVILVSMPVGLTLSARRHTNQSSRQNPRH